MTTLEAVNYVLRRVGLSSVSTLETGTNSPAGEIESLLDETRREVCEMGWQFNRREDFEASPDDSGHIVLHATGSMSVANPTVVTSAGHGLTSGDTVWFRDSTTTPALAGAYTVTVTGADTFTVPVNVSGSGTGTYTVFGGEVLKIGTYGVDSSRTVVMQDDRLYDRDENTDEFDGDLCVWYTLLLSFADCPPQIQTYIAAKTAVVYIDAHGPVQRSPTVRDNETKALVRARQYDAQTGGLNVLDSNDVRAVKGHRYDYDGMTGAA